MKFSGKVSNRQVNKRLNLGGDPGSIYVGILNGEKRTWKTDFAIMFL